MRRKHIDERRKPNEKAGSAQLLELQVANWIRVYLWFCTWSMRLRMTPQYKCKKHDWMDSYEPRKDKETIEG